MGQLLTNTGASAEDDTNKLEQARYHEQQLRAAKSKETEERRQGCLTSEQREVLLTVQSSYHCARSEPTHDSVLGPDALD